MSWGWDGGDSLYLQSVHLRSESQGRPTQINILDTQDPQTLFTSLFCVFARTVQLRKLALDKAEFSRQKNVGSFARSLEPFADGFFIVVV